MSGKFSKTAETIGAISDYCDMLDTIAVTAAAMEELDERITSPRSSVPDGMPHVHNPQAGENKIASGLDALNAMKARLDRAESFVRWFESAWQILSSEEQALLETYKDYGYRSGALSELADEKGYSERQMFRKRKDALARFGKLLFGPDGF